MGKRDLAAAFADELRKRVPEQAELIDTVARVLGLEREAAYRRVAGRVAFSISEMGALAAELGISIDSLMYGVRTSVWLPMLLEEPLRIDSLDALARTMDDNLDLLARMAAAGALRRGVVCGALPIEFFAGAPMMTRFMFFKWGHHFVRSAEFDRLDGWQMPVGLEAAIARAATMGRFSRAFYVWDDALVWALAGEIAAFHRMRIITTGERDALRDELREILVRLEQMFGGTRPMPAGVPEGAEFYVSSTGIGLTAGYFAVDGGDDSAGRGAKRRDGRAGGRRSGSHIDQPGKDARRERSMADVEMGIIRDGGGVAMLHTNFSLCTIADSDGRFHKMRDWVDAFRSISTLVSGSGRPERRAFFTRQREIIDWLLGEQRR